MTADPRWGVVARCWIGFAGLGAGMLHVALAIGSPAGQAIVLVAVGGAEFLWGVLALGSGSVPVPAVARLGAVLPIVAWVAVLLISGQLTDGLRIFPLLVASLLDAGVALGITLGMRGDRAAHEPRTSRGRLLAVGAGALVIAALVLPALVATEVGDGIPVPPLSPHPEPGHPGG